ncbi:GNAT family N-acetyltransferase [Limosilactobacillus sp.]|jgi:ribosomal protein S18 acetylase RimI-like enzyme|uniref:GNAT family N-acetyltransferase n=1 Tax=Limosilactobacillus sp. TaxID=2773925 RepID=UPI0025BF03FC|nr:GNAT family N-acetyltransferase [Limosilactobacillus sp.]MCH3921439.1 GNAT family N-acetyltransferase [Limosilactobacillus sp.]MCH3928210.1 GNAT family N-acetyltransferase [Limosilactobacillus sp.]
MIIQQCTKLTPQHWQLLLLADPERAAIQRYINSSTIFEARHKQALIAIIVLQPRNDRKLEIKNIAVHPHWRGQHVATRLLEFAQQYGRQHGYQKLLVGTGSTSFTQLYLYQKVGFRVVGIDRDFFVRNYRQPIYENRLRLRDMLILALPLVE